jgi:hypothetical protein
VVHVCRQAIAQWGAPDAIVSDNAGVFLALSPCLQQLGIRWAPIARGYPWQNLAEGGFSIQRRMLDAYVAGCTNRESVYRQHAQFVRDYQFWGHWAHKRQDDQGRLYYVSPEVMLGNAKGRLVEASRLRRIFRSANSHARSASMARFGCTILGSMWIRACGGRPSTC